MAYLPPQDTTNQEDQTGQPPQMASGESSAVASQGAPSGSAPAKTSSGTWTNLNKYLTANQPQAAGLGEKVAGQISGAGQAARQAISGASDVFNQQAQSATPTIDQTLLQKAWQTPQALSPEQINQFNAQRNASYGGPMQLSDVSAFSGVPGAIQTAQQTGELLNTEGGRQTLVGNLYQPGQFRGLGMTSLDAMLLQNSPEAFQRAQAAQAGLADIPGLETSAEEAAKAQAAAGKQAAQDVQQNFKNTFFGPQGYIPTFESELQQRAQNAYNAALANEQAASQGLTGLSAQYAASPTTIIPGRPDLYNPLTAKPQTAVTGSGLSVLGAPSALPSWATELGLNQDQYGQLLNALQSYSTFDYGGVKPAYADYIPGFFAYPERIQVSSTPIGNGIQVRPDASMLNQFMSAPQLDLSQFVTQMSPEELKGAITEQTVQTPEEAARLSALDQLLGGGVGYAALPGQAGTAPTGGGSFDLANALSYINTADQAANQAAYQALLSRPDIMEQYFAQPDIMAALKR